MPSIFAALWIFSLSSGENLTVIVADAPEPLRGGRPVTLLELVFFFDMMEFRDTKQLTRRNCENIVTRNAKFVNLKAETKKPRGLAGPKGF